MAAQGLYTNPKGVEVQADMEFRNATLYQKLRASIEDACQDSLSWRPHTTKYQNLIQSILAEQIVAENIEWWALDKPIADVAASWLDGFFKGYQEETENGLVWDVQAFDRAYSRFEEFLYQDPYMNHFVSPLYSFYYDSSAPVELETGVYIREPDSFLFKYLTASQQLSMSQHMSRGKDWVVDIIVEEPKSAKRGSEGRCSTKASNKARRVLQSLRLLHKGKVFTGPLYYLDDPEFAGFRHNMGALHDTDLTTLPLTHPSYLRPDDYQLREQEVEELKDIYALIPEEFSSYPALRLCLDRFGAYFRRSGKLDGLLDLVIALEALFGEGSQGITYKLALRCAYLLEPLEPQFKERRQIFDKLRCIYDIRSCIVHGRRDLPKKLRTLWKEDDNDKALERAIDDAAEYVRRAIREVLREHLDKMRKATEDKEDRWDKFLDDLVLRGTRKCLKFKS
ncbi:HEPN domain-containing protein [Dehalococcoidia bacterium]|nr:HEPN domain-containing protein [Dehalococcoidia bacterium]